MSIALLSSNFPNGTFCTYLRQNFDTDRDGVLSDAEIANITKIDISNSRVTSIEGVQYLTALKELFVQQCNISSVNLTGLSALERVNLTRNPLSSVTFGNHPNLRVFSIGAANAVSYYGCTTITVLNMGNCPNLRTLVLDGATSVTSVDISGCPNLEKIDIGCTGVQTLDVHGLTSLREIWCTGFLDGSYTPSLTALNAAGCTALTTLDVFCAYNLESISVSGCSALQTLSCGGTRLSSIDLTGCSGLQEININETNLTTIDLSGCSGLRSFKADNSRLTSLDFRRCPQLYLLYASGNVLTDIQFSTTGKNLELVCVNSNRLTSLNLAGQSKLKWLWCWDNDFTELDIDGCTAVVYLYRNVAATISGSASNPKYYQESYISGNSYESGGRQLVIKPGITVYDGSPFFLTQPADARVYLDAVAQFSVAMRGDVGITGDGQETTFQWQRRAGFSGAWSDIGYGTGETLREQAFYTLDGYQYRCAATNYIGTTYSETATLTIDYSITVTGQPQDLTVNIGEEAIFTVTAAGGGLHHMWKKKRAGSDSWVYLDNELNSTLRFTAAKEDNGCQYRCHIDNYPRQLNEGDDESVFNVCESDMATLTVLCPPEIQTQPLDQAAAEGATAVFVTEANGDGISYQWQCRASGGAWNDISDATGASLSVQAAASADGYQYRCAVSNTVGTTHTNAATLTVVTEPQITAQPQSVTVESGSYVEFAAAASGYGLGYQWQSRSAGGAWADIGGETGTSLRIQAERGLSGTQYRCVVSNLAGSKASDAATMTALDRARIVEQPQSAQAFTGETVAFSVTASGDDLSYQWQQRANENGTWADISGETGTSLSVQAAAGIDGYQYRCAVGNTLGSVSSEAVTLSVVTVKIMGNPVDLEIASGEQANFTVTAAGENLSYQWESKTADASAWDQIGGATGASYTLTAAASDDGKRFRCRVSGDNMSVLSGDAGLTVVYPAVITRQPQNTSVTAGETAAFHIEANGHYLRYQWQVLSDGVWQDISGASSGGAVNSNEADYTVATDISMDGCQYRCAITTSVQAQGAVYSNTVTLSVTTLPHIQADPQSVTVASGGTALFTVTASGEGLSYQWQSRSGSSVTWSNITGENTASITVQAEKSLDGYQYRCAVSNSAGEVQTGAAMLTVLNEVRVTRNPEDATAARGTVAVFTVTASGDGLQYRWQERAGAQGDWMDSARTGAAGDTLSFTVSAEDDGIHVRCRVWNDVSEAYSQEATLTVVEEVVILTDPQSAQVTAGTTHTFTVTAAGGGLSYRWQEKAATASQWEDADGDGAGTPNLTVRAASGKSGTSYRCIVANAIGSETSDAAVLTVVAAPVIVISPRNAIAEQGKTVQFSVTASGDGLRYQWQVRGRGADAWEDMTTADATGARISVTATEENNVAQFRCVVSNANGSAVSDAGTLYTEVLKFHLADEEDGMFPSVLPQGSYIFALNASGGGAVYSLGFGTAGDTRWVCTDESGVCMFESDGTAPLRIVLRATAACTVRPMLEAGNEAHGWISPKMRDHDAANEFNYDWFSLGNCFDSNENVILATMPCNIKLRYRPYIRDVI